MRRLRPPLAGGPSNTTGLLVIGWQERIDLPQLGLTRLHAKIDTGARTSALHADEINSFDKDGETWVRFHTRFDDDARDLDVEWPVLERREVKNTGGVPEERIVIRTRFRIAGRAWPIDLSLTDRGDMRFRMIVGRTALRGHSIVVHPGRRNLAGPPDRPKEIDS
ncbi:ATP-dependent zinc protease family protein [Jannaschia seohaensis]|uniref:Uncharacterized conserved protein n=1 Tax=Jannaschia seohaensis TaxID=475081 RepID=A0A2Y9B5X2_9RHOB|nr:RimK/LysX family protein [Jannaschia seohaensis]PWJ11455.1 hypothetical protein BCF38_11922 [Jannaschia seohaensis]SSA51435.1 Uncharacterized conserved protein [Jannaschia seohaensis]